MRNNVSLTVLEGGYGKKIHSGYHFIGAVATNTRLMGVVGLHVTYQKSDDSYFHELYHLDFESYGVDGYECYTDPDPGFLQRRVQKMMGGLGGCFVELEAKEVRLLLTSAVTVAPECLGEFPEIEAAFPYVMDEKGLSSDTFENVMRKVSKETLSVYELIHYFMMRTVGMDWTGRKMLLADPEDNFDHRDMTLVPSTLLRESIEQVEEGVYRATALLDGYSGYDMVVAELTVAESEGHLAVGAVDVIRKMKVSSIEAAMMLKQKEFLSVYALMDETFEVDLDEAYPEMMINDHEAGVLCTRFKADNTHVDRPVFQLSGDVYGLYYLTDEQQMVISSFDENLLAQMEEELERWVDEKRIAPVSQFVIDVPILYDFVSSGFGDFFDFINAEE